MTAQELRDLLHYDPRTGLFTWRDRRWHIEAGSVAGCINAPGYCVICVGGVLHAAHRLAWLYVTGEWPSRLVDHKNRDRADNRWSNLRLADHSQNHANQKLAANNTSGVRGVWRDKRRSRWVAEVIHMGKKIYLGSYHDIEDAKRARRRKAEQLWGEYA